MSTLLVLIVLIGVVVFVLATLKGDKKASKQRNPIKGKRILTMNEQPTFFRLREALPEHIILAQVAFSAFMTAKGFPTRNLFNRKAADFGVFPIAQSVPESNPIKESEENLEKTKIITDAFIFQSELGERKKLSE